MKYYKIQYKEDAASPWQEALASNSVNQRNISNLLFSTQYKVIVVAINNKDLSSNSAMRTIVSVADSKCRRVGGQAYDDRYWQ